MAGVELLPKEYGYVVLVIALYCLLDFWMGVLVWKARNKYKVHPLTIYALDAENIDAWRFNFVQSGHQDSLQLMPVFFILMILGGIRHPLICALLGSLYTVSRFLCFMVHANADISGPLSVFVAAYVVVTYMKPSFLALLGLIICTISSGVNLLLA